MAEGSARGTARCKQVLAGLPREWRALHDVRWPGRRGGQIDHVVVGPAGVLVVSVPERAGRVRRGDLARARRAAAAVAALVPSLAPGDVRAVVYLDRAEPVPDLEAGVVLAGDDTVVEALTSLPRVLDEDAVRVVWRQLGAAFGTVERTASRRPRHRAKGVRRQRRLLAQGLATLGLAMTLLLSPGVAGHAERIIGDLVGIFAQDDEVIRPVNGTPADPGPAACSPGANGADDCGN